MQSCRLRAGAISESIVVTMACLAPWAYGSVDAGAELALDLVVLLLVLIGAVGDLAPSRGGRVDRAPGLALGGLVMLAMAQAVPLPGPVLRTVAPVTHTLLRSLAPAGPQRVAGDAGPPIAPPLTTLSLDPEATIHTVAQLAGAWLLFRAVLGLGSGYGPLRRFGLAIMVNSAALALFSVAQSLAWDRKIYGIRPIRIEDGWYSGGPFVCHNHLAAFLNLGLGFALASLLLKSTRGRRSVGLADRALEAFAAGLIAVGVLASHSRGGFLAACAASATLVIARRPGDGPRRIATAAAVAAAALVAALLLAVSGGASAMRRLATIADVCMGGFNGRVEVWAASIRAVAIGPIWGSGLGAFPAASAPFFERDGGIFFSHAENEYLQMLVEGGAVGLGLALVAVLGIARLGYLALAAAPSTSDRAAVAGALFGGAALAVQSLGDFPLHIPGVSVAGTVLCAHLCRLGVAAGPGRPRAPARGWGRSAIARMLAVAASLALGFLLLRHGLARLRAEALVAGAGLPVPGSTMPTIERVRLARPADLELARDALVGALRERPDWYEGHLRLGIIHLGLYERAAVEFLRSSAVDPDESALLADPLVLHGIAHDTPSDELFGAGGPLDYEPIRNHLGPAARCFLEARRCCPSAALAHAGLASVDYLIEGGESCASHAERALRMAGYDSGATALAALAAHQAGDEDLAGRCWRETFRIGFDNRSWPAIADDLAGALPADEALLVLATSGRDTLRFACRFFEAPKDRETLEGYLWAALERLPRDRWLSPAERSWHEGRALARLGDRDAARSRMANALRSEPAQGGWREEFVTWLIRWGEAKEGHRLALAGVAIDPGGQEARRCLKVASEALARTPIIRSPGATTRPSIKETSP